MTMSRIRLLIGAFGISLGLGCLLIAMANGRSRGALLHIETPTFNGGVLANPDDRDVKHSFVFNNIGSADLLITKIATTCGCTVGVASKSVIPPNSSGTVDVTLRLAQMGETTKEVLIYSNSRTSPQILTISGVFKPMYTAAAVPAAFTGEVLGINQPITKIVKLEVLRLTPDPIRLDRIVSKNGICSGRCVSSFSDINQSLTGYYSTTMDVEICIRPVSEGRLDDDISIVLDDARMRPIVIPVSGVVREWSINPPRVLVVGGAASLQSDDLKHISVKNVAGRNFHLASIGDNFGGRISVTSAEQADGTLDIAVTSAGNVTEDLDGEIVLQLALDGIINKLAVPVAIRRP